MDWEVSYTRSGEETIDVKVREGGTEIGIPSDAKEEGGSLVCWAITDCERVQTGLRLEAKARDLRRAIVGGDG